MDKHLLNQFLEDFFGKTLAPVIIEALADQLWPMIDEHGDDKWREGYEEGLDYYI